MVDFDTEESHGRGVTALPPNSFEESTRSHTPAKKATERKEKAGVESVLRLCTCTGIRSKRTEGRHDLVNEPLILQPRYKTITEISLGGGYVPAYYPVP